MQGQQDYNARPSDPEHAQTMERYAEAIAINGPSFLVLARQRHGTDPNYVFLHGGPFFQYFYERVYFHTQKEQASQRSSIIGAKAAPRRSVVENKGGTFKPTNGEEELAHLVSKYQVMNAPTPDVKLYQELHAILSTLENRATTEAIKSGKEWMERMSKRSDEVAALTLRITHTCPTFSHRLHILYLVHDIFLSEVRNDTIYTTAFQNYIVWLLKTCYSGAQLSQNPEKSRASVLRILELWKERGIVKAEEHKDYLILIKTENLPEVTEPTNPTDCATEHTNQPEVQPWSDNGWNSQNAWQGWKRNTPETMPVGVMATMIRVVRQQRAKANQRMWATYTPIESYLTPQVMPKMVRPEQRVLDLIGEFYDEISQDEDSGTSSDSGSNSDSSSARPERRSPTPHRERSRSPS